jgi:hypothetical protein
MNKYYIAYCYYVTHLVSDRGQFYSRICDKNVVSIVYDIHDDVLYNPTKWGNDFCPHCFNFGTLIKLIAERENMERVNG